MGEQSARGDRIVQVQGAYRSTIQVEIGGETRELPLEPATIPVPAGAKSPTRLVRARSGVVPYAAREGLLEELEGWLGGEEPFAGKVIGGQGGSGKTRLAVALCEQAEQAGWVCGFLAQIDDQAALEALIQAPARRLVVVDYAESRIEQLKNLLPLLAANAAPGNEIRVLLLVRAAPRHTADWTERLRNRNDWLDAVLDEFEVQVLEDVPLGTEERAQLFEAAANAFAARIGTEQEVSEAPATLGQDAFAQPLMVVIAAYLATHGEEPPPADRAALLDEVLAHEQRYWRISGGTLFTDDVLPRRVIALSTLTAAQSETESADLLKLLPDLADASAERRMQIARWAHDCYPGSGWWNPLEPDLVGEHLVASALANQPTVLEDVLKVDTPSTVMRPLEVYTRAAADHPEFVGVVEPVLNKQFAHLCELAVTQASHEANHELLYGGATTVATTIDNALGVFEIEPKALFYAERALPSHSNLLLASLASNVTARLIVLFRVLAEKDRETFAPELAASLNDISLTLGELGRYEEGLAAGQEAVELYRSLPQDGEGDDQDALARALNNVSIRLASVGRREEALEAIREAVELRRRRAADDPTTYAPRLAGSLSNLANRLGELGRRAEALRVMEEAVAINRSLAVDDPGHKPELARALTNLSIRLAEAAREAEGLVASEEAVAIYRPLAAAFPAAYDWNLAQSLNNLAVRLGEVNRSDESLVAIEEAVAIDRRLAAANPSAYERELAGSLMNFGIQLNRAGRPEDAIAPMREGVEIFRKLSASNPTAFEQKLANALANFATSIRGTDPQVSLEAAEEAVTILRRLDAEGVEYDLTIALISYANSLKANDQPGEALEAVREAEAMDRRLLTEDPAHREELVITLNNLSALLRAAGQESQADRVDEEIAELRGRE